MKQRLDEPNTCDPIDHAVMRLGHQSELVVLDAFDDPELPERPAPVESLREEPTHEPLEHSFVSGKRKPRVAKMKIDVESIVFDPNRMTKPGHPREPLPVTWHRVECRQGVFGDALHIEPAAVERQRFRIEEQHRADVHGRGFVL